MKIHSIMKKFLLLAACLTILSAAVTSAQTKTRQYHKGWPSDPEKENIREGFVNPPKGYGNVPFYWWSNDSLSIERLTGQLEILSDASTDGLCISYHHTHADVDTALNAPGYGACGRVEGGKPRVFSDEWRQIWAEFSGKCAEKGIGMGMDDYVVAFPGNGEYVDSILAQPSFRNYPGRLVKDKDGKITTEPSPELHPEYGAELVRKYFQPFEDSMDEHQREGMNYFFQDELIYKLDIRSWCEGMPEIFRERKGYDIMPYLDYLFIEKDSLITPEAARIRIDYADVLTGLAQERYFGPIFDWHDERGLIYGCDNNGRGLEPTMYLDYFKAISNFTAPGNDAPARGSSFRETKVSSSIAHLYGRPRTWLEAFHSMGWDANGGVLIRQLDHHIIAGGNLLCMHGLYYSTHGGWWEWAPPCFHFHMPYWPHMKLWIKRAERMCYLLSQGSHVCDVALLYPTESMQAYPEATPHLMFDVSESLSAHGIDYDFINPESLRCGTAEGGCLRVAGESYKVIVLADIKGASKATLDKLAEFRRAGGIVLTTGFAPEGLEADESFEAVDYENIIGAIRGRIQTDFAVSGGIGKVLHRHIGSSDVYMVMDVPEGDVMTFRASGRAEIWDPFHGTMTPVGVCGVSEDGLTSIRCSAENGNSQLIVFSPGEPLLEESASGNAVAHLHEMEVEGDWDIEIIPTLDNTYGDFRLPASPGLLGVESRRISYTRGGVPASWSDCPSEIYGYGPYMLTRSFSSSMSLDDCLATCPDDYGWTPYVWSWQYGVPDSPGRQGYHGLKARVDSKFLILDKGGHQLFRTKVYAPSSASYRLVVEGVAPDKIVIDSKDVTFSDGTEVKLSRGWHDLVVAYCNTEKKEYSLESQRGYTVDYRKRAMVMLYPLDACEPAEHSMYDSIVASKWYDTPFLKFNPYGEPSEWIYSFETAPGAVDFEMAFDGKVVSSEDDGHGRIVVHAVPSLGCPGASAFKEPVRIKCEGGKMPEGDWSKAGALEFFSGGIRYSKTVVLPEGAQTVVLDLGEIDATCEVTVGGVKADVLLTAPYRLDISSLVHPGENLVEVLVYSSLSNHYQSIPSPYRGTARAGLIGPVRVLYR